MRPHDKTAALGMTRALGTAAALSAAAALGIAPAGALEEGKAAQQSTSAAASARARAASGHTVVLRNTRFHPGTLTVRRGDSVTWSWRDAPTEHNVTGKGFKSRTMAKGSFTVRFTHRGSFSYRCTIHGSEGMVGKVVVR